jgi:Tol biopolymer transport system component
MKTRVSCLVGLFLLAMPWGGASETVRDLPAVFTMVAPTVDGVIAGDMGWEDAVLQAGFENSRTGQPSQKQSRLYMGYTEEALYLSMICEEPEPDFVFAAMPDGESYDDEDSVTLFLSTDDATLLTFSVNAMGSRSSNRTLQAWEAQVHTDEAAWIVEMRIPWEVIGAAPQPEASWAVNVMRYIPNDATVERSTWASLDYDDDAIERFGRLQLPGLNRARRASMAAAIDTKGVQENLLVLSRPDRGLYMQSGFREHRIAYNQGAHLAPKISPDGTQVLFTSYEGGDTPGIWITDRAGTHKERICNGEQGDWSLDGTRIIYVREGKLVERTLAGPGPEKPSDPSTDGNRRDDAAPQNGLVVDLVDMTSAISCGIPKTEGPGGFSSDGSRIAQSWDGDISIHDRTLKKAYTLLRMPGLIRNPVWSRDGKAVAFAYATDPVAEVWEICAAAVDEPEKIYRLARRVHAAFDWHGNLSDEKVAYQLPAKLETVPVVTVPGTVALENHWLRLEAGPDNVALLSREGALEGQRLTLRVTDRKGQEGVFYGKVVLVLESEREQHVLLGFRCGDGTELDIRLVWHKDRPWLNVMQDEGRIGLSGNISHAITPDRLASDVVFSTADLLEEGIVHFPQTFSVLAAVEGGEVMAVAATSDPGARFLFVRDSDNQSTLWAEGFGGRIGRVAFSLLQQPGIWAEAGADEPWQPPFPAQWRGDTLRYAWGRGERTPMDVWTPVDVLMDWWGVEGYVSRMDERGVRGWRSGDVPVAYQELSKHGLGWHPAMAAAEVSGDAFGILEIMGSVFAVNTPGVRSLLENLGGDVLHVLRGLDVRVEEYKAVAEAMAEHELRDMAKSAQALLGDLEATQLTDIARVEEDLSKVMGIIGARDDLTLSQMEFLCKQPGNEELAAVFEEFYNYLAAREGRLWHKQQIRMELWYEEVFKDFARHSLRIVRERQAQLAACRQWAQAGCMDAARLLADDPAVAEACNDARSQLHGVLRNRQYLEGDWRGERPLAQGEGQ